jgi:CheY-like chemotaxis protein
MLALVNSLLDWTRLQTGRMNFEPDRINAKGVVDKAVQMLAGNAMQKNINLESQLQSDVFVHADENLLLQVFNNLISNAIKFTPQEGDIFIKASPLLEEREYQFSVQDSGVGIKEENISKLFKVDSKFTLKGTEGEKGSGLGLSLVHEIIQKHGGKIWVESEEGKGTEIFFTLPVSSTSILLVDDANRDRLLYSKLLKSIIPKYDIVEASNGKEAFEHIKQTAPALVISEHDMPGMSGYEMVRQISLSDMRYKPPFIILSNDLNSQIVEEYYELGIEYVFPKPVNLSVFKIAIEKSLKKAIF